MHLYCDAKKYDNYPVFSYKDMYNLLDEFETIVELVAGAKDPQSLFEHSKISVGDILDIQNLLYLEFTEEADKRMKQIFKLEKMKLFDTPGKNSKNKRADYAENPFIWDIRTIVNKQDRIRAFEKAKEFRGLSDYEKEKERGIHN